MKNKEKDNKINKFQLGFIFKEGLNNIKKLTFLRFLVSYLLIKKPDKMI